MVVLLELGLGISYYITKDTRLNVIPRYHTTANLPENPDEFVKTLILGGSSSEGFGIPTNFADILQYELFTRYPNLKIFVANDAESGWAFHGQQAQVAKAQLNRYDIFIIYAGHNEAVPYLRDSGFFTPPGQKIPLPIKPLVRKGLKTDLDTWLRTNSRLFTIAQKLNNKLINKPIDITDI